MHRFLPILIIVLLLSGCDFHLPFDRAAAVLDSCAVTRPPVPAFMPPGYQSTPQGVFWYGSADLWVALPTNGIWYVQAHNYTQKVFWGREGYVWTDELEPELYASLRRLDGPSDPPVVSRATNGFEQTYGSFMLIGVDFPTPGCWEITGSYHGKELSFVVWVAFVP